VQHDLSRKKTLPEATAYACKFWIEHLCLVSDAPEDIVNRTYNFLIKHLLHWMEALAILNSHDHTIRSLHNIMKWLQVCPIIAYWELSANIFIQKSSRSDTDLHQLTVTALHSTSQTPSWSTHCCFTRRPYHLLQQVRVSSRTFITVACQKSFVAWMRCGLQS
jgi:hypothetical protein